MIAGISGSGSYRHFREFLSVVLRRKIAEQLPDLCNGICEEFAAELARHEAEDNASISRKESAAHAREARLNKLRAQRERYETAGRRLNALRREAAEKCRPQPVPDTGIFIPTIQDDDHTAESPVNDFDYEVDDNAADAYQTELLALLSLPKEKRKHVTYSDYPVTLSVAFLLCSLSRPVLRLAHHFLPLPCDSTIYLHYGDTLKAMKKNLASEETIVNQAQEFMRISGVQPGDVVSVAVDAMAMAPDRVCLAAKSSDYLFVYYAQPLNRSNKCMALHMFKGNSGSAVADVQKRLELICHVLTELGVQVKFVCSDGDPGHNKRHHAFFMKWHRAFLKGGLAAALDVAASEEMIPVTDFLHLLKNFCNKVKNHPVTICPELPDDIITCEDLEWVLQLGNALNDRSSIGRMRDSYALQLFALKNCCDCMQKDNDIGLMYLLPWALQEEVIRSPTLSRPERLEKALLSFDLLVHYFDLSFLPRREGVTQRFTKGRTAVVTFAEDSAWPRILNFSLILIYFVLIAPPEWSFSRLGTHCLENFFGFVRQNARADDRTITAMRIMARTTCVCVTLQDLGVSIAHQGRDNVGGVVIGDEPIPLTKSIEDGAFHLARSFLTVAGLDMNDEGPPVFPREQLISMLEDWRRRDSHHCKDQAYKADFTRSPANTKIAARNRQASSGY
jgi:hypothetical protein